MQVSEPVRELQAIAAELNVPITSEKLPDELDNRDELKSFRDEFYFPINKQDPNKKSLYFCGNSLGLQPKNVRVYLQQELDNWAERGVYVSYCVVCTVRALFIDYSCREGHHEHSQGRPWINTDEFVTPQMTKVVGGEEGEVVVMNSLSANLHLMMVCALDAFPKVLPFAGQQCNTRTYKDTNIHTTAGPYVHASVRLARHHTPHVTFSLSACIHFWPFLPFVLGFLLSTYCHTTQNSHRTGCLPK